MQGIKSKFIVGLLSLFVMSEVMASLMISPTRLAFEERDRAAHITIINTSDETKTYRLDLVDIMQTEQGGIKSELAPEDRAKIFSAKDMIRFSPRQVTLGAGETQRVRLSVRKPANLPEGEYRSHLSITELPPPERVDNQDNVQIRLHILMSFTIPVFIRNGDVNVSAKIQSPRLLLPTHEDKNAYLALDLARTGNYSTFGSIKVEWRPNQQSAYTELTFLNSVAVYREISKRENIKIRLEPGQVKQGWYRVSYTPDGRFNQPVFDEIEVFLKP